MRRGSAIGSIGRFLFACQIELQDENKVRAEEMDSFSVLDKKSCEGAVDLRTYLDKRYSNL